MSYTTTHPKLGKIEVIIEAEIDHAKSLHATEKTVEGVKHFALVKSSKVYKDRVWPRVENGFFDSIGKNLKLVKNHYVLWGNSPELEKMGITQLVTPTLRPVQGSSPVNWFFRFIKSSEFMTFVNKK